MTKLFKNRKITALFAALLVALTVAMVASTNVVCYAANQGFYFKVKADQYPSSDYIKQKRNTSNVHNAWSVRLDSSTEAGHQYTMTVMYLGVDNPNGYNLVGSTKRIIKEGSGTNYYSAYKNASNKYVYIYAHDNNDGKADSYDIGGYWNSATGHDPENDSDNNAFYD